MIQFKKSLVQLRFQNIICTSKCKTSMYCFVGSETKMFMTVDISFQNELQRQTPAIPRNNNEKVKLAFEGNTSLIFKLG